MPEGSISLIFGPMFSGKSTELVRRLKRFQIAKRRVLVIKYGKDVRYSVDKLSTHDRQMMPAVSASRLEEVIDRIDGYDVIGVDEGQFFPDVVQFCEDVAQLGKTVIVSALDGDFRRKPFGSILELIPLAEYVVKLSAVCMICTADAAFSKRIVEGDEIEKIGGSDMYVAVCRKCYNGNPKKSGCLIQGSLSVSAVTAPKEPKLSTQPADAAAAAVEEETKEEEGAAVTEAAVTDVPSTPATPATSVTTKGKGSRLAATLPGSPDTIVGAAEEDPQRELFPSSA